MFQLTTPTEATLRTLTPRTEKHGDEDVSAVSLGLTIKGPNTHLDTLQPGLRDMLYKPVDGQDQLPGVEPATPLLRAKGVESVKLASCFEGWTLKIDRGIDEDDPIALGGSKVDAFFVVPREGGSIDLHFRVGSSDIDEDEAGWLFVHLKQSISITLHAPEAKQPWPSTAARTRSSAITLELVASRQTCSTSTKTRAMRSRARTPRAEG